MAQQDKTDWYWNGELAGAVNNLYYDLINVDVCHVPYATNHRNSSFFLKTRLAYTISEKWDSSETKWYEVTDLKILWESTCSNESWWVYALWRKDWNKKTLFKATIENWCVKNFKRITDPMVQSGTCWDWKLLVTDYVKWEKYDINNNHNDILEDDDTSVTPFSWDASWIQINQYNLWTQIWLFSDENVKNWRYKFKTTWDALKQGNYILVYYSNNLDDSGFAWQVRMVTGFDSKGRIVVDAPWLWFKVIDTSDFAEWESKEQEWNGLRYAFFTDWWEVVGFTNNKDINLFYWPADTITTDYISVYNQAWLPWTAAKGKIIWVASTSSKVFVLTQNWYIHYSKEWYGYNKFFIDDDMFAWPDKIAITAYRDMVLAFGRRHIAIWVPDEQDKFWTMYDQSQTIWLWSRYSFTEYNWYLMFVSNDKRLLTLWIWDTAWRYLLEYKNVEQLIDGKLSSLIPWDEVFLWSDNNDLRVICNKRYEPYEARNWRADIKINEVPISTNIYKYDTLFQVWTEDYIRWHLLKWATEWVYFGEDWIYVRQDKQLDCWDAAFETVINAYLMENESDWVWWNNSRLANRPKLYNLAKLNRIITTLWPGIYSNSSKIRVTAYSKWIWYQYEFPISWDWNDWLWLITSYYTNEWFSPEESEKIECMKTVIQDSQYEYQYNCSDWDVFRQYIAQHSPWCEDYGELITESHAICINDKIYQIAPTMPLTTSLWENQQYSTQIKLELIWWEWDIICFGWRLAEMFIAPLFSVGPDWEYQLQPETNCSR